MLKRVGTMLLDEFDDESCPPGLVARAKTCPIIAVKILVEKDVVAPVGIILKLCDSAIDRAVPFFILQEDFDQAVG